MSAPDDDADPRDRLAALWDSCAVRVQAFALRHSDPDTAQDVVSETFLVVARHLLRNARRAARRRLAAVVEEIDTRSLPQRTPTSSRRSA